MQRPSALVAVETAFVFFWDATRTVSVAIAFAVLFAATVGAISARISWHAIKSNPRDAPMMNHGSFSGLSG